MSDKVKTSLDTPAGYNGQAPPSASDLKAPTKIYPASSNLGKNAPKVMEGPGERGRGGYQK